MQVERVRGARCGSFVSRPGCVVFRAHSGRSHTGCRRAIHATLPSSLLTCVWWMEMQPGFSGNQPEPPRRRETRRGRTAHPRVELAWGWRAGACGHRHSLLRGEPEWPREQWAVTAGLWGMPGPVCVDRRLYVSDGGFTASRGWAEASGMTVS